MRYKFCEASGVNPSGFAQSLGMGLCGGYDFGYNVVGIYNSTSSRDFTNGPVGKSIMPSERW